MFASNYILSYFQTQNWEYYFIPKHVLCPLWCFSSVFIHEMARRTLLGMRKETPAVD